MRTQHTHNPDRTCGHAAFHRNAQSRRTVCYDSVRTVLAPPVSLAATQGMEHELLSIRRIGGPTKNSCIFLSFPLATKMFQFTRYPSTAYVFSWRYLGLPPRWVAPFGYSRVKGCLGPHRDFSHPATSFFGFLCLGIHRLHLSVCATA